MLISADRLGQVLSFIFAFAVCLLSKLVWIKAQVNPPPDPRIPLVLLPTSLSCRGARRLRLRGGRKPALFAFHEHAATGLGRSMGQQLESRRALEMASAAPCQNASGRLIYFRRLVDSLKLRRLRCMCDYVFKAPVDYSLKFPLKTRLRGRLEVAFLQDRACAHSPDSPVA